MTSERNDYSSSPSDGSYDSDGSPSGAPSGQDCPDCRPETLDRFSCQAEGVAARAKYHEDHKNGPSSERYEAARLEYGKARHAVEDDVQAVDEQLGDLTDKLRCDIDSESVVDDLDRAWEQIKKRLRKCQPRLGCRLSDDYRFDTDVPPRGLEVIKARIAEYEYLTSEAEKVFDELVAEPERLKTRVKDLQEEVNKIERERRGAEPGVPKPGPKGDEKKATTEDPDFKRLYARAVVAGVHLEEVWWGYDELRDYVECICLALRISLEGRAALAWLTGELAERVCRRNARQLRCKKLNDNVIDAIIERYVRIRTRRPKPHQPAESGYGKEPPAAPPRESDDGGYQEPEEDEEEYGNPSEPQRPPANYQNDDENRPSNRGEPPAGSGRDRRPPRLDDDYY